MSAYKRKVLKKLSVYKVLYKAVIILVFFGKGSFLGFVL